jgi:hypothetical protein
VIHGYPQTTNILPHNQWQNPPTVCSWVPGKKCCPLRRTGLRTLAREVDFCHTHPTPPGVGYLQKPI